MGHNVPVDALAAGTHALARSAHMSNAHWLLLLLSVCNLFVMPADAVQSAEGNVKTRLVGQQQWSACVTTNGVTRVFVHALLSDS